MDMSATRVIVVCEQEESRRTRAGRLYKDQPDGFFGLVLDTQIVNLNVIAPPHQKNVLITTANLDQVPPIWRQGALVMMVDPPPRVPLPQLVLAGDGHARV